MTIGIDLRCLTDNITSGVSVYVYNLLKNLLAADSTNYYKIFTNRQKINKFFIEDEQDNIKIYNFNIPNKLLNASLKFLNRPKIDELIGGVDVFWLPNINFIALSSKCRLITTVHDVSFKIMPELYSIKRKCWHYLINPEKIFKRSETIISVSYNTKSDLIKFFSLDDKKIEVIYPGIENSFSPNRLSTGLKHKYGLSNNFILTVATLEPRKNIESVILAFDQMLQDNTDLVVNNWQLIIAGKRGWLNKTIFKLLKEVKFPQQIKFLDNLSRRQLPELYHQAKVLIWPSYYEGFGFPPLEAKRSGLPVITSFNSSLLEVLGDKAIYINPFNIRELSISLKTIIKDEQLSKCFQDNQQNVDWDKKYNWKDSALKLLNIINSSSKA